MKFISIALFATALLVVTLAENDPFSDGFGLLDMEVPPVLTPAEIITILKCTSTLVDRLPQNVIRATWNSRFKNGYDGYIKDAEKCSEDLKGVNEIKKCILQRIKEMNKFIKSFKVLVRLYFGTYEEYKINYQDKFIPCVKRETSPPTFGNETSRPTTGNGSSSPNDDSGSSLPGSVSGAYLLGIYLFIQLLAYVQN